jgi:hypothetical protein
MNTSEFPYNYLTIFNAGFHLDHKTNSQADSLNYLADGNKIEEPRIHRLLHFLFGSGLDRVDDLLENVANCGSEESQNHDNNNRYQNDDQSILDQALSLFFG